MDLTSSQRTMFRSLSRLELCRGRAAGYTPETEEQEEDLMDLANMGLAIFDGSEYRISGKGLALYSHTWRPSIMSSPAYHQCRTIEDSFLYFLDCQLATVEGLELKKRPPKGELARHRRMAEKMIEKAREHGLNPESLDRVQKFLAKAEISETSAP